MNYSPGDYTSAKMDFRFYLEGSLASFTHDLYRCIQHADWSNLKRLELGFPAHVAVFRDWINSTEPQNFFNPPSTEVVS